MAELDKTSKRDGLVKDDVQKDQHQSSTTKRSAGRLRGINVK